MPRPLLTERISFGGFAALRLPFRVQASLKESNYILCRQMLQRGPSLFRWRKDLDFLRRPLSEARASAVPVKSTLAAAAELASGAVVSDE
jgi:hypothetical protein